MNPSVYRRPNKPMYKPVRQREMFHLDVERLVLPNVVAVDAVTDCHVTPLPVGARMVELAQPFFGDVLEPQGGTGNLVQCLLDAGVEPNKVTSVEKHIAMSVALDKRFGGSVKVHNECFLEFAASTTRRFRHIVTNPPFRNGSARRHIQAALSLLDKGEGCSLVGLVPVTFEMDGFEEIERLPEDTFEYAKVHTKIVMFNY